MKKFYNLKIKNMFQLDNTNKKVIHIEISTNNKNVFDNDTLSLYYIFLFDPIINKFILLSRMDFSVCKHFIHPRKKKELMKKLKTVNKTTYFNNFKEIESFSRSELVLLFQDLFHIKFRNNT